MTDAFSKYSFIAYVKVIKKTGLEKQDSGLVSTNFSSNQYGKVSIEVIEMIKGKPNVTTILEWGVGTSCDMGIRENDEWIFFGNYINGSFVSVGYCDYWFKMKNLKGERSWQYDYGIAGLKELRKIATLPEKINPDGEIKLFYPDGTLQVSEQYKNGELQGARKIYSSKGVLTEESEYLNGILNGKKKTYSDDGQLLSEFDFENGQIGHSVFWYDTSFQARRMDAIFSRESINSENINAAKIQKQSEGWFNLEKGSRYSFVYYRTGELETAHYAIESESVKKSCEYYKSGVLKFEMHYFKEGEITYEKRWNEAGILVSDKKWIKGKFLGDLLKKD